MRLTVDGKQLKEAISWGAKGTNRTLGENASGAQTVIAISSGFLHVKSCDGQKFFSARVSASGISDNDELEVRVYGETLVNATNVITSEPVTVDISDSEVNFILPRSEFSIPRTNVRGPKFPDTPQKVGFVNAGELRKAATKAATTALKDSHAQPVLGAVMFEFSEGDRRLRIEATNRISMFVYDLDFTPESGAFYNEEDAPAALSNGDSPTITSLVAHELVRTITSGLDDDEDVSLYADENYFGVEGGNYSGYVSLVDASPVAYKSLMELATPKRFTASRKDFATAVKNVNSMSQDKDAIFIYVNPNGIMRVADAAQKARVEVDIKNVSGIESPYEDDVEEYEEKIKFNPAILLAALNAATTENISLSFNETVRPMVIRETKVDNTDDKQFFYMVMPLR